MRVPLKRGLAEEASNDAIRDKDALWSEPKEVSLPHQRTGGKEGLSKAKELSPSIFPEAYLIGFE